MAYVNTNANQMFEDFNRGVADMDLIDIRGMDTRYTNTMHNFFCDGTKSVKNYNIDGIDTSKVWDFSGMFAGADQLAPLRTRLTFQRLILVAQLICRICSREVILRQLTSAVLIRKT